MAVEDDYVLTEDDKACGKKIKSAFKKFIDLIEFRAFLGLWFLRGLWSQANSNLAHLFSADAIPVFGATMSRER